MNKLSRTLIFLSSILIFITIFAWNLNPNFAWYQRTLVEFLGDTLLKVQIFNTGYTFVFNHNFLSNEEIATKLFNSPQYMSAFLHYVPMLILATNLLLLISAIIGNRFFSLLSSISLLMMIVFMSFVINLLIKNEFYPIRPSLGPLLAGSATFISILSSFLANKR